MKKRQLAVLFTGVNDRPGVQAETGELLPPSAITAADTWLDIEKEQSFTKIYAKDLANMETAEDEPRMKPKPIVEVDEAEAQRMIKEEPRGYLDGYYEGYRVGLNENKKVKEGDALRFALKRLSTAPDTPKNRAYKYGVIEGYTRAKAMKSKKAKADEAMKLITPKAGGPADGSNVNAKSPGGTLQVLVDPLMKKEVVYLTPDKQQKLVILMYRDPNMAHKAQSKSGEDDDSGEHKDKDKDKDKDKEREKEKDVQVKPPPDDQGKPPPEDQDKPPPPAPSQVPKPSVVSQYF
ncbi:unnamed protein product [Nippostrongylus brasiliensis]|uniref:PpiC domain-containing protein n=1 Tax=Nippostrongylus brasiliensis TaxID=27835 RepID=A0A0N4YHU8_NIPBR|nr:unnamed protein product [Nippostrongylus brasiliensis]